MIDVAAHTAVAERMTSELGAPADRVLRAPDLLVHVVKRPTFHALFTTGMSDRPMMVPTSAPSSGLAELVMWLPADWKLDEAALRNDRWAWPITTLQTLVRLPEKQQSWLGHGHTIPNGDPPAPFVPGTLLSGVCLVSLVTSGAEPVRVETGGKRIEMLEVLPITRAEMELAVKSDPGTMLRSLAQAGVSRIVAATRACSVTGKKPSVRS